MKLRSKLIATTLVATGLVSSVAHAALHERYIPGEGVLIYDDISDVTWGGRIANPNSWQNALDFAALSTTAGFSTWRLPTINELGTLYNSLLNQPNYGTSLGDPIHANTSAFGTVWSSVESVGNPDEVWIFHMGDPFVYHSLFGITYYPGNAYTVNKSGLSGVGLSVLIVMSGDVVAVPEAETYALMLAGLALIGWRARRRG
ncbi:MAG: DUF1566 domain-containing protein [Thiobacillus sp.]